MKIISRITAFIILLSISLTAWAQDDAIPFTIEADSAQQAVISALYQAYYGDEPTFIEPSAEQVADLTVTQDPSRIPEDYPIIPHHFLVDTFILVHGDHPEAQTFADFTISADGQQVLIDAGYLPDSVTIIDQTGREVVLPQPVRGVLTPYSIATYLVYGVDAQDRLLAGAYLGARDPIGAGRMEAIDPNFPNIESRTMTQREINIEEVALLNPDVIFTSSRATWLDAVAELGIPTILFEGESPELLQESLFIAGQVFGPHASVVAQVWTQYYGSIYLQVLEDTRNLTEESRPRVLMVGENPLRVIGGDMYQTSMIEIAGGVSVTEDIDGHWHNTDIEAVLLWNPDVIVIAPYGDVTVETFTESAEWQIIDAVKNGNVYKMPSWVAPWETPVPDSVLGIVWLTEILFDGQIGLSCSWEVEFFYSIFYQHTPADEDIRALCEI
jgi:iron complex transport system substrate-binding protein